MNERLLAQAQAPSPPLPPALRTSRHAGSRGGSPVPTAIRPRPAAFLPAATASGVAAPGVAAALPLPPPPRTSEHGRSHSSSGSSVPLVLRPRTAAAPIPAAAFLDVSAAPAAPTPTLSPTPTPPTPPPLLTNGHRGSRNGPPIPILPRATPGAALIPEPATPGVSGATAAPPTPTPTPTPTLQAPALRTHEQGGSRSGPPVPTFARPVASEVSGLAAPGAAASGASPPPRTSGHGGGCNRGSPAPINILPRPRSAASLLLEAITSAVSAAASVAAAAAAAAAAATAAAAAAAPPPPAPALRKGGQGGSRSGSLVPILPRPSPEGQPAFEADRSRLEDACARGSSQVPGRARRGRKSSYDELCAKCNQMEENSKIRFRLCKDKPGMREDKPECGRWVHKHECLPLFNAFALQSERCCKHHNGFKNVCCCRGCQTKRRKGQPGSREGGAAERGGAARGNGRGRGHVRRTDGGGGIAPVAVAPATAAVVPKLEGVLAG